MVFLYQSEKRTSLPARNPLSTQTVDCPFTEGQYLFTTSWGESIYAHFYNGVLFSAYQDGSGFKPRHWLTATGLMTAEAAACFAEDDPHTGNPDPTPTPNPGSLNPYSGDAYFINGVVGIGAASVNDRSALLSVKGKIRAQEVRIENVNWPDYVFTPQYKLLPLPALETYLSTHHHLPGIPSAQEVAEKGVLLGDMNARLLEKVEELTLQVIALEKRTRRQERELARFRRKQLINTSSNHSAQ